VSTDLTIAVVAVCDLTEKAVWSSSCCVRYPRRY